MRMFRRWTGRRKYDVTVVKIHPRFGGEVRVTPRVGGVSQVLLQMTRGGQSCGCDMTEDEVRLLIQALSDGIEQSKAVTALAAQESD